MTGIEIGLAIWFACCVMALAYLLASLVARHEHTPGPHPNGRCGTCGASLIEETS